MFILYLKKYKKKNIFGKQLFLEILYEMLLILLVCIGIDGTGQRICRSDYSRVHSFGHR